MTMPDHSTISLFVFHAVLATGLGLTTERPVGVQDPGQRVDQSEGPATARCSAPAFREFDFWLGRWEVRNPDGELVGHNEIRREAGGCGLLERWQGAGGGAGISVNTFDADLGRWTQRWVGAGATLWLEGGLVDGPEGPRMVLEGTRTRSTPQGEVLDRITWQPLDDARVRQVWEISPDGGESWNEIFRGLYVRAASSEADGPVVGRGPGELEWREAPSGASFANLYGDPAEAGPFAFRMRMPPGFEMQPHSHNTAEHVTVLSGTLYMRFSTDGEVISLPAGSVISIPAEQAMWGWAEEEETEIQVQGVGPFRTTPVSERGGVE